MVLSCFSCLCIRVKCTYSKSGLTVSEATPGLLKFSGGLRPLFQFTFLHGTDQHNIQNVLHEITSRAFLEYNRLSLKCEEDRADENGNFSHLILPHCCMTVSECRFD